MFQPLYLLRDLGHYNGELLEKGCCNLFHHVATIRKSGIVPVVCINHFYTDTDEEVKLVRKLSEEAGALTALSKHWQFGGEGAEELAEAVEEAAKRPNNFKFFNDDSQPIRDRVMAVAKEVYGAGDIEFLPAAQEKLELYQNDPEISKLHVCMVKTHLSLSHDPDVKGRPTGFTLPIRDILLYRGAGFIVPVAGDIKLMPGTGSDPAYRRIDIDVETGRIHGLF